MIFKNLCILVLWAKVASALEELARMPFVVFYFFCFFLNSMISINKLASICLKTVTIRQDAREFLLSDIITQMLFPQGLRVFNEWV